MTLANAIRHLYATDKEFSKDPRLNQEATYDVQYPTGFMDLDYHLGQRIDLYDETGRITGGYDSVGIVDGSINMFILMI